MGASPSPWPVSRSGWFGHATMRAANPLFVPRNHRIEAAIAEAEEGRHETFHELNEVLARPYEDQPGFTDYAKPPHPHEEVRQTFCGT